MQVALRESDFDVFRPERLDDGEVQVAENRELASRVAEPDQEVKLDRAVAEGPELDVGCRGVEDGSVGLSDLDRGASHEIVVRPVGDPTTTWMRVFVSL